MQRDMESLKAEQAEWAAGEGARRAAAADAGEAHEEAKRVRVRERS